MGEPDFVTHRGGARPGSGPKPMNRFRAEEISPVPPEDLSDEQKAVWQKYAPLAIENRTLVKATEPTFRQLCELEVEKGKILAQLDHDGRTYIKAWTDSSGQEHQELKAHPLMVHYGRMSKEMTALFARFGLAPFGKPVGPAPKRAAMNPWQQIAK